MARRRLSRSTALQVGGAMLLMTLVLHLALRIALGLQLQTYESERAEHTLQRLEEALGVLHQGLADAVRDWSLFDDSYGFMADSNQRFIDANLTDETTQIIGADLIAFIASNGSLHHLFLDPAAEADPAFAAEQHLAALLPPGHAEGLIAESLAWQGLALGPDSELLVYAMHPILRSDGSGPNRGLLLFSRRMTEDDRDMLSRLLGYPLSLLDLQPGSDEWRRLAEGRWLDADAVQSWAYAHVDSPHGNAIALAQVAMGAGIRSTVYRTLWFLLLAQLTLAALGTLCILALLGQRVIHRLRQLNQSLDQIAQDAQGGGRVPRQGDDEIGQLAAQINQTLDSIDLARSAAETARQQAQDANQAKTSFLSSLSHEIRTPMNGIVGMLRLLEQTPLNPQQREYLDTLDACSQGLLGLIGDVLDLAKIESGSMELNPQTCDLVQLLIDALAPFRAQVETPVFCSIAPEVPQEALIDAQRVRQVLLNLVGNAVKFSPQGRVEVHCSYYREEGRDFLLYRVSDNGIGMSEEEQARLFQPFTQASPQIQQHYGGSGLGLVLCKRFAQAMGGDIRLSSQPGQGSTFFLSLLCQIPDSPACKQDSEALLLHALGQALHPQTALVQALDAEGHAVDFIKDIHKNGLYSADPQPDALLIDLDLADEDYALLRSDWRNKPGPLPPLILIAPQEARHDWLTPPSQIRHNILTRIDFAQKISRFVQPLREEGEVQQEFAGSWPAGTRLLIVDDSALNRLVARDLLSRHGLSITEAENGIEAIERWRIEGPDAILMDCRMPGMDGYAASAAIRRSEAEEGGRSIPIIAVTGDLLSEESYKTAGMQAQITKPFTEQGLVETLARYLPGWTAAEPSPAVATSAPLLQAQLRAAFQQEAEQQLRLLQEALRKRNSEAAAECCHALLGISANCACSAIHQPLRQLRNHAQTAEWPQAEALLDLLSKQITAGSTSA